MSSVLSRTTSLSNPRTRGPWRPPWLTWWLCWLWWLQEGLQRMVLGDELMYGPRISTMIQKTKNNHHEEPLSEETCIGKLTDKSDKKQKTYKVQRAMLIVSPSSIICNILGVEINNRAFTKKKKKKKKKKIFNYKIVKSYFII